MAHTNNTYNPRYRYASESISNAVFYVPFVYFYQVRLGTVAKLLSWAVLYLFPTLYYSAMLAFASGQHTVDKVTFLAGYVLLLLATFTLYETGYILNDCVAIRRETEPTIRLYDYNFEFFRHRYRSILSIRLCIIIVALASFALLFGISSNTLITIGAVMMVGIIFFIYNDMRSLWNVALYPLLVFSRYIVFLIPYLCSMADANSVILLFLVFPLPNALERLSMPRHRFRVMRSLIPDENAKTKTRIWYYLILTPILFLIYTIIGQYSYIQTALMLVPFVVMLCHRTAIWLLTLHHAPRNYLQG